MDSMTEFMSRETIKEKIDDISDKFFDFQITHEGIRNEVEEDLLNMVKVISNSIAEEGELTDQLPIAVGYLLDTVVAQLIIIKLQNKFIENYNKDKDDD